MKLISCLIVFCLILIVLSSGSIVTTVGQLPKGHIVLEQSFDRLRTPLHDNTSPVPGSGRWVAWGGMAVPAPSAAVKEATALALAPPVAALVATLHAAG